MNDQNGSDVARLRNWFAQTNGQDYERIETLKYNIRISPRISPLAVIQFSKIPVPRSNFAIGPELGESNWRTIT